MIFAIFEQRTTHCKLLNGWYDGLAGHTYRWGTRVHVYIYVILGGGVEVVTFIMTFICGGLVGMYVY